VIVLVGLSHKTAPLEVRERAALPEEEMAALLQQLVATPAVGEALVVSTCNRVEIVAAARAGSELERVADACRSALVSVSPRSSGQGIYALTAGAGVRHLFGVASSLDSLVLGEPQILGQVKDAYETARVAGTVGSILHRVLSRAIHAAKLVRSQTAVGSGQVSVPTVAADLARRIFGELSGHGVLLIGSGEMAETVARLLAASGARLAVTGRSLDKVQALAEKVGGLARPFYELGLALRDADVVISSTSAPGFVIERGKVAEARRSRRGKSQFYIDLAVPRDVDPAIEELDGTFLYNIDDFSRIVSESLASRTREADRAQANIDAEAKGFDRWADGEQATPTIVALRARIRGALRTELDRSLGGRLRHLGSADRAALETMLEASVNRLLHLPTTRLRQAASLESLEAPGFSELATVLTTLFALAEGDIEGADLDESGLDAPEQAPESSDSRDVAKLGSR
jgi:glutamyl-tRNA reductase